MGGQTRQGDGVTFDILWSAGQLRFRLKERPVQLLMKQPLTVTDH